MSDKFSYFLKTISNYGRRRGKDILLQEGRRCPEDLREMWSYPDRGHLLYQQVYLLQGLYALPREDEKVGSPEEVEEIALPFPRVIV